MNLCLVSNDAILRRALAKIFEGAASLTAEEWRAFRGIRTQLETGAARQRRAWLQEELAGSGLPARFQWSIIDRLKSREFTPQELDAEIQSAREKSAVVEE